MQRIGLIILAAGGSTRLGQPKQLLDFEGDSLLVRATHTALTSICRPIVIVLGAYGDLIRERMRHLPVTLINNPDWELGLGSSIHAGLDALPPAEVDGTLLMLADQPLLTAGHLNDLAETFSTYGGIVASAYDGVMGPPAIFANEFRQELLALPPSQGAKPVIEQNRDRVRTIDFPQGVVDIDTAGDYEQLLESRRLI